LKKISLEEYLQLEYPVTHIKKDDGYEAWHPDFGSGALIAFGETLNEAISELEELRISSIQYWYENGITIPLPSDEDAKQYSGQFVLRIPRTLHGTLTKDAKLEGVSLNTYISYLLSERHIQVRIGKQIEHWNVGLKQVYETIKKLTFSNEMTTDWELKEWQRTLEPPETTKLHLLSPNDNFNFRKTG